MRWKERIYVKQRRMVKALISSVLVVLLCCTGAFAASSGTTDITVRVKYGQSTVYAAAGECLPYGEGCLVLE